MIRSPAGYGGENRIKRYLDYYQPSYGAMMLAEGLFGFSTPAGVLLGAETSGMAIDFTSAPTSTLVRTANSLSTNYYSGLPFQNEGNGPVTFSRASNATVTDSDGKIKWAGHNLLTNSESFGATAWTKSSATVTANTDPAPNGTTTGDTIAASGANGTALQTWTAEAVPYTFGVWLRRKTGTGNIQIAADSGTYTTVTITSSWALYTVTQTPAAGSKSAGIRIVSSGDEVYAWGAHLYRSDLGGMVLNPARGDAYYPTTPRNLLGFTESLTTGWTNSNTTDSIVAETNPNGLANSVEVAATAGNGTLLGSLSLLASPYTFSIWLKRKTGTGTVEITVDGTTYVAAAVTGTWTRFSTTLTPTAGTKTPGIRLVTSGDAVYAWGAQLSDSASLDAYSPVYGAAVTSAAYYAPRLDYDPVTLAAKGLLVEEQRTNFRTYSRDFTQATAWTLLASTTVNNTTLLTAAPDGTVTAQAIIPASNGRTNGIVDAAGAIYITGRTVSFYAKAGFGISTITGTDGGGKHWTVNLSTGASTFDAAYTYNFVQSVGNGWWRIGFNTTNASFYVGADAGANGSNYFYLWGVDVENGVFATSFIPTGASTATRTADVASVSTQAFPYSATEGSLVASFTPINVAAARRAVQLDDGTTNERITLGINSTPNGLMTVNDGGVSQASIATGTPAANTTMKLAARYKVNDFAMSANGAAVSTDTSGTLPTVDTLRLGSGTSSTEPLNGWLRQVTYLPRALTNAELQARTV